MAGDRSKLLDIYLEMNSIWEDMDYDRRALISMLHNDVVRIWWAQYSLSTINDMAFELWRQYENPGYFV